MLTSITLTKKVKHEYTKLTGKLIILFKNITEEGVHNNSRNKKQKVC